MTRIPKTLLLVAAGLVLAVPAFAQGDPPAEGTPAESTEPAPPPPSFLPTGPVTVGNPDAEDSMPARPRIAIIPFIETYSADGVIVATGGIGEILTTEMQKTGRFTVVAKKEQLKELVDNLKIEQGSGLYDMSTVSDLGRFKGAEYIFMGRITHASLSGSGTNILGFGTSGEKAEIRIDFGLYNSETGELVYSGTGEGNEKTSSFSLGEYGGTSDTGTAAGQFSGAIVKACEQIVDHIIETDLFPVRASVKGMTSGGKVYVDLGYGAGFWPGLKLDVREIQVDTDMDTGEVLGYTYGSIIGELTVDEVQPDRSICHVSYGDCKRGYIAEVPKGTDLRERSEEDGEDSTDARQTREGDDRDGRDRDDDDRRRY